MKLYYQAALVAFSFLIVFIWQNSGFAATYTIPMVGFLVFLFLLVSLKNKVKMNFGGPANFFFLNTVILLFIFSTGGLASALFFILYFLLFAASFIMDPRVVFIIPIGALLVFWNQIFTGDITENLIKIGSLILITPLAYFFGVQFAKNQKQEDEVIQTKERAVGAADEISKDVDDLIQSGKNKLNDSEISKLNEILQETEDLRNEKEK